MQIYMYIYQMNGTTTRQKDETRFNIRAVQSFDQMLDLGDYCDFSQTENS